MGPSRRSSAARLVLIAGVLLVAALAGCASSPSPGQDVRAAALRPPTPAGVTTDDPPLHEGGETGIVPVAAQEQPPKQEKGGDAKAAEPPAPQAKHSKAAEKPSGEDKDADKEE